MANLYQQRAEKAGEVEELIALTTIAIGIKHQQCLSKY